MFKKIFFILLLLLLPLTLFAESGVEIYWEPSLCTDAVTGYQIQYGTQSGSYTQSKDVGNVTSDFVTGLVDGQAYYFIVRAYDAYGNYSEDSNEVYVLTPVTPIYSLQVINNTDFGVIAGPNISCGQYCTADYEQDTPIALQAYQKTGYRFAGWSGDCSGTGICYLTMNSDKQVYANFELIPTTQYYSLHVNNTWPKGGYAAGNGVNCGSTCDKFYPSGTVVTLKAYPNKNYAFAAWMGDCTGNGTCKIIMNSDKRVSAYWKDRK